MFAIAERRVGPGNPVWIVAEISGNHNGDFDRAARLIEAAREAGADAVKLQTYTADTLTIDSDKEFFRIRGTAWEGRTLHQLYQEAHTPWEWQPRLKRIAGDLGIPLFSTPFDPSAVDFLEDMGVPAYKVASFEIVDIPLLERVGRTGKPVILSTGMASLAEIDRAVTTLREAGAAGLGLLCCVSAYPAPYHEMNLATIPHLGRAFAAAAGLSDHTLGIVAAVAAVALGATIIEKHLTLSRADGGPDAGFSLEPEEFAAMVEAVRQAEAAVGEVTYGSRAGERESRVFRRSLFVVADVRAGERFTASNLRSIRPGHGLSPAFLPQVIGRRAAVDIERGTPLSWELVGGW